MDKMHIIKNKLSPRYSGPYRIIYFAGGNEYIILHLVTREVSIRHVDSLKRTKIELDNDDYCGPRIVKNNSFSGRGNTVYQFYINTGESVNYDRYQECEYVGIVY